MYYSFLGPDRLVVFQNLMIYQDLPTQTSLVYRELSEKEKTTIQQQFCGRLVDAKGQRRKGSSL